MPLAPHCQGKTGLSSPLGESGFAVGITQVGVAKSKPVNEPCASIAAEVEIEVRLVSAL